ncbi:MAG: polysaccharide lyase family 8 super-sandwich domain-containing protein [Marinifilaceae bacterium]
MRNYLFLFCLLLFQNHLFAQNLQFKQNVMDLGTINRDTADSIIKVTYTFSNTGSAPLKIKYVLSGCGCTTVTNLKNREYAPGQEGELEIAYNIKDRKDKHLSVTFEIYSNTLTGNMGKGISSVRLLATIIGAQAPCLPHYNLAKIQKMHCNGTNASDEYETILARVKTNLFKKHNKHTDSKVEQLVATLRRGGYWQHIDYGCYFRTDWEPNIHLSNVEQMALSYTFPQSEYYGNDTLFCAISDALNYWNVANPISHNWWHNQIAVGQRLANILVLMASASTDIDASLKNALFAKMAQSDPRKWTGANKMDIAMHHLYRGCLLKNDSIVTVASQQIFYPLQITKQEGIQQDWSYHQHGNQLYFGGYGIVLVSGIIGMSNYLYGTRFDMAPNQKEIFSNFIRKGFLQVFRGKYLDFSVSGRGISRENCLDYAHLESLLDEWGKLDKPNKQVYTKATEMLKDAQKENKHNNINFWRSDYMVHNRPQYQATVRSASTRTCITESGNGENLKGCNLSDGALTIRCSGDEYYNVFPVWEWDKIPGVTSKAGDIGLGGGWSELGTSNLTGGVSNGKIGAYGYKHNRRGFTAQKAYFFFDKDVVALGSNIFVTDNSKAQLQTTINQCRKDEAIICWEMTSNGHWRCNTIKDSIVLYNGNTTKVAIQHSGLCYVILDTNKNVTLKAAQRKGNWVSINNGGRNTEITDSIFSLVYSHDTTRPDSYAYAITVREPNANVLTNLYANLDVINTPQLQAVYHKEDNVYQVLFHTEGTYQCTDFSITVDSPAYLIVNVKRGKYGISISNPLQNNEAIQLHIRSQKGSIEHKFETIKGETQFVELKLKQQTTIL